MIDSAPHQESSDEFIIRLVACQNRLYAYVYSLMPDAERARDIVQDANLIIWRKAAEFETGTNFEAWACKIAYFEVLASRRKQRHDRLVFSDELIQVLSKDAEARLSDFSEKEVALEECLKRIDSRSRGYLLSRYSRGGSVKSVAEKAGMTPSAAGVLLYRIRKSLSECIQGKLVKEHKT